jgi:teichuronic acid biosynthesis glycosyltransferase TuaC
VTEPSSPHDVLAGRRILVVARWYPAFDDPASGIFVADHVRLLVAHGAEVVVASWDPTPLLAGDDALAERLSADWAAGVAATPPLATPRFWGASVPVARLPAVTRPRVAGKIDEVARVRAQSQTLVAFGRRLHETWPIDLIHAHTGLPDGAAASDLADVTGAPLVTTEHDSTLLRRLEDATSLALYRRLFEPRRAVVAVSQFLASRLQDAVGRPVGVLPNPVDLDAFVPGDPAERHADELLWVGRRRASKGMATLLEAVAVAHAARRAVRLRALGSASDAEDSEWRRLAGKLGIAEAISFEPVSDRAAIAAAMRRASVFVHPSPFETFGLVAAEALAMGLPVACTPSGGVDEIVGRDGRAGEVAEAATGQALAAAILRVLHRPTPPDAKSLRASIAERYGADAVAARTAELYGPLLSAPSSSIATLPPTAPRPEHPVVFAFRRAALDPRAGQISAGMRHGLTVVTNRTPGTRAPEGFGRWIEIDDDQDTRDELARIGNPPRAGALARAIWLALHPLAAIRRRQLAKARPAARLAARRVAVELILHDIRKDNPTATIEAVVVDSDDRLAVEPLLGSDVPLAAGGLRWLADGDDARDLPPAGA